MKTALVPVVLLCGAVLAACDDDPDVVVTDSRAADRDGDSVSFSVGDDGVSFSSEDNDGDGSRTAVSVGDGGVSVQSED